VTEAPEDAPFEEEAMFEREGWPALRFVERSYAGDWTNWWIPNRAASEAMLRAAGFSVEARFTDEVILARVAPVPFAELGLRPAAYPKGAPA
jgi:tRNA (mo5U34)-methyltransferase